LRVRLGILVVVVSAVVAAAAASARAGTALIVTGHGWGHGVGMSQWGAYGYAKHGWKYRRILSHYYPGTKLSHAGEVQVRVLLTQGQRVVTVACSRRLTVSNGGGLTFKLKSGTYGIGPKLLLPVRRHGRGRSFGRLVVIGCPRAPLMWDGRPYHGSLMVRSDGRYVSVINALSLDNYVRGVVPSESPPRWPLAELEAQAVAARSYAVAQLRPGASYDLVSTTSDQVYGGIAAERPRSDNAVVATHGQILTYHGQVARTYYSSSSGGRTEAVQDAWPGSAPVPYLRSVRDPYDTYSPHHDWGPYELSAGQLAARLRLGSAVESVKVQRDDSLRAASVAFRLASGRVAVRSAASVTRALNLLSTWFSIGELRLSASSRHVLYGSGVTVVAHAANVKGATLEQRSGAGPWRAVRHTGYPIRLRFQPHANTAFRLAAPGARGTRVSVAVAPRVKAAPLSARLLGGKVSPRPHARVEIWRRERGRWRVVAHPILDSHGVFKTPLRLRPVAYRITVAADGRLAGTQTWLRVTRRQLQSLQH
jgi:stage II sporulation protein D